MAERIEGLSIGISLDSLALERGLTGLKDRMKTVNSELRANLSVFDRADKSVDKYETTLTSLNKKLEVQKRIVSEAKAEYEKLAKEHGAGSKEAEKAAREYNNQAASLNNLERRIDRTSNELRDLQEEQRKANSGWTKFSENAKKAGSTLTGVGDEMKGIGKSLSMSVTAPIVGLGTAAFKASVDFESAFAGVRKTVDTTEEGFAKLEKGIRDMAKELPASADEIAAVAESAGQLGIAEENILSFSKTIIDLGESTNMTRDQAATEFARFANIVGMSQGDFDRLGSSIVGLGNTMATTESEIMSMGMRLAAQGAQVGMTEAQIMALAGTMSSLGIQAEMGGTAMTTILKKLQRAVADGGVELRTWAEVAQMSADEFKELYDKSAIDGLDAVIKGLSKISDRGINLTDVLEDMGIKGIYESDVMLRLSGASDLLSESVNTSTKAWKENNALTNEAEQRYKTTASQMKILWNNVKDLGIEMGGYLIPIMRDGLERIKPLIKSFGEMDDKTKKMILTVGGLVAAAGPLLLVGGTLMSGLGGTITAVSTLTAGIGAAGGLTAVITTLTGPVGLTVLAVGGLTAGFIALDKAMDKPIIKSDIFKGKISEATKEAYGSYHELQKEARAELELLANSSGEVADQIASNMVQKYTEMGDQVLTQMKANHANQLEELSKYFADSNVLTDEEENKRIQMLLEKQQEEVNVHTERQARIMELLEKASSDKYELESVEIQELRNLTNQANNEALTNLVKSQEDQIKIRKNMKDQKTILTTEETADMIKKAIETRDGTVSEAKKMRDEKVDQIKKMKEDGLIQSQEESYNMISEAQKQYVGVLENANAMRDDTITAAKQRKDANVETINLETGEILSGWDQMYNGVITAVNWIRGLFGKDELEKNSSLRNHIKNSARTAISKYEKGTPSTGHPGGPAIVGEEGVELAHIPGEGITLLGENGPEFLSNLPRGSSVLPNKHTERLLKSYGFPGYADGIGDYFDLFLKGAGNVWDFVKEKFDLKDFNSILDIHTGSPLKYIGDMATSWIKDLWGNWFGDIGSISAGSGVQRWAGLATKALMMTGQFSEANLNRMLMQMDTESSGNPRSINLWDSNAKRGTPSKGLMQVIDPTFRRYAMPGYNSNIWDPLSNMLASIRYSLSRYGSLSRAWRGVGYETGGLINNEGLYRLAEGGWPEFVIPTDPARRTDAMKLLALAGKRISGNKRPNDLPGVSYSDNNKQLEIIIEDLKQIASLLTGILSKDTTFVMDGREVARGLTTHITEFQSFENSRNLLFNK